MKPKTFLSVRKEPIRIIRFVEGIDVGEFLYDDHAELSYCDENKLDRWNDMIDPKESNKEKFEQEYECIWVGVEKTK
jgi:hypothetical protein